MKAEIFKAFAGQGEHGHRLGTLPSQTCCVKQSSARLLVAEGAAHQDRHADSQKKGLFFSGSDCDSAFAGDGAPFAPGTSSTYRAAQDNMAPLAQVWYLPGAAGTVTLQHTCLPGHQLQATCSKHPRDEHSRELREGPNPQAAFTARKVLVRNKPRVLAKEAIHGKVNYIKN